jgi:hypothetical protein
MAHIARPSVLFREVEALRSGLTSFPGSSSSSALSSDSSTTASGRRPTYLEREDYDHHCRVLEFIRAYEPHPAFAVGCLQHLIHWYERNRNTREQAACDFFDHLNRVFVRATNGPYKTDDSYLDRLSVMFFELHPEELKRLSYLQRTHQKMLDDSASILFRNRK